MGEYVEHAPAHSLCLATVFAQMVNRDSAGTLRGHVLDHFERGVGAAVVNKGKHDTCILILLSTVLNFSASEPAHECSPRSLINMHKERARLERHCVCREGLAVVASGGLTSDVNCRNFSTGSRFSSL